jgi:hypothetical protein
VFNALKAAERFYAPQVAAILRAQLERNKQGQK